MTPLNHLIMPCNHSIPIAVFLQESIGSVFNRASIVGNSETRFVSAECSVRLVACEGRLELGNYRNHALGLVQGDIPAITN